MAPSLAEARAVRREEDMRKLTGRFDFRRTLFGNQVLVVEEDVPNFWPMSRKKLFRRRWRRATPLDLATPELRGLMDLMRADRPESSFAERELIRLPDSPRFP
jgi:hypothetical protein